VILSYSIEQYKPLKVGIGAPSNNCNSFAQLLSLFAILISFHWINFLLLLKVFAADLDGLLDLSLGDTGEGGPSWKVSLFETESGKSGESGESCETGEVGESGETRESLGFERG